ncbi:PucR family transcriptional regulator [Mycetocola zhadangensis]|uniref:PucR family transcriptional regulator n=1 Tax=Mycetocola zhadangensis TaxID=1164595 RepID=A0A3L7J485_9MICO|nr:helix-turn-helix domain-containing protein [Mycetocola zhadangensis]RLQ85476.1 PucR family transcriptional regulator [Mycetocola zhadangensis]GGE82920.1 PucR family transcriptional regulator [Mycetocola zhadangensis]
MSSAPSNSRLVASSGTQLTGKELLTRVLGRMDSELPWFRVVPIARRTALESIISSLIDAFVSYCSHPDPSAVPRVFSEAPAELVRSISLEQTLQLIRSSVAAVEDSLVGPEAAAYREASLDFSRQLAFEAAELYAMSRASSGLWDSRLEQLAIDAVLSGRGLAEMADRLRAVGWRGGGQTIVVVGAPGDEVDEDKLRRLVWNAGADALAGVRQGSVVLVLSMAGDALPRNGDLPEGGTDAADRLASLARDVVSEVLTRTAVFGDVVSELGDAAASARASMFGARVVHTWLQAPTMVRANELLPERALNGDADARATLVQRIVVPLEDGASDWLETVAIYLDNGRSIEGCARALDVHANTIRYRLARVSETLGFDITVPRNAFVVQCALRLTS